MFAIYITRGNAPYVSRSTRCGVVGITAALDYLTENLYGGHGRFRETPTRGR